MAGPAYKPLAVNVQGSLPGVFDTAPNSFEEQRKQAEALQAQELANQINEVAAQKAQQNFDRETQLSEALKAQFGVQEDGTTPEFDPQSALKLAGSLAIQQGDIDTALNVEKATRSYASNDRVLTDVEATQLDVPIGTSLSVAKALLRARDLEQADARFNDPTRVANRELDALLKDQRSTGTQIRPPTAAQVQKIGAGDAFIAQMDNMEQTYIPQISENRGARFLEAAVNPNSPEARLYGELNLAAKQAALSLEDRVTDQDFKTIQDIATPQKLDTNETIINRMARLKEFIQRRNAADLNAMEAGGFNASGLQNRQPFMIPKVGATGGAGNLSPEEATYKEQYKAKLRAERGL